MPMQFGKLWRLWNRADWFARSVEIKATDFGGGKSRYQINSLARGSQPLVL